MIQDRLIPNKKDDEIDIVTDELKISFKCPITYCEMKIPAKGFLCTHIEVRDIKIVIYSDSICPILFNTNKSIRRFKCPHWNKSCNILKIDSFISSLKSVSINYLI